MCHCLDPVQDQGGPAQKLPTLTFDPQLIGFRSVMNTINRYVKGGAPSVLSPLSLTSEEQIQWERSTKEDGKC